MSDSQKISDWKKKAEIDYFSPFINLWFSFNVWMKQSTLKKTDRACLNYLKTLSESNSTYWQFKELIESAYPKSNEFELNFSELISALENARIFCKKYPNEYISLFDSFHSAKLIQSTNNQDSGEDKRPKIDLASGESLLIDQPILYRHYLETVYQIRCELFHGSLELTKSTERVIKYTYLTFYSVCEKI